MTQDQLFNKQAASAHMGAEGERFVLAYERKRLPQYLHEDIVHYADSDIAMGYDILSFNAADSLKTDRYIEVKTYRGHKHFYWSEGEITAAHLLSDHYYLYLVDYDQIRNPEYQPEIIQDPARLFDLKSQWVNQPINYVFSELSPQHIPTDWFDSIVLLGCYNTQAHLQWILKHRRYNVRAKQFADSPAPNGEVFIDDSRVRQARYLLLYQVGAPQNFMFFELSGAPKLATNQQLRQSGYPNPHFPQYVVHTIARQLPSFYVNLQQLFREALPKIDNARVGQPLYLAGPQLAHFMPKRPNPARPIEVTRQQSLMLEKRGALWTDQEDNLLRALLQSHTPISEISRQMSRSENSITRRMDRLRKADRLPQDLYMYYHSTDPAFTSRPIRPRR